MKSSLVKLLVLISGCALVYSCLATVQWIRATAAADELRKAPGGVDQQQRIEELEQQVSDLRNSLQSQKDNNQAVVTAAAEQFVRVYYTFSAETIGGRWQRLQPLMTEKAYQAILPVGQPGAKMESTEGSPVESGVEQVQSYYTPSALDQAEVLIICHHWVRMGGKSTTDSQLLVQLQMAYCDGQWLVSEIVQNSPVSIAAGAQGRREH